MDNVIRPVFGNRPKPAPDVPDANPVRHHPLKVFGEAAGYVVALVQDETAPEGPLLKVAVGRADSDEIETVAMLPPNAEGAAYAEAVGHAILRTLEIVEGEEPPKTGA